MSIINSIVIILFGIFLFEALQTKNVPILSPLITRKAYGVTIAGSEFPQPFYSTSSYSGFSYFHKRGLTLLRLPFSWENVQPHWGGNLGKDIKKFADEVQAAGKAKEQVIIEPHNFARYNGRPLTPADAAVFADFWGEIALYFKNEKNIYGYELMNEPHDLVGGCQTWKVLAQEAVTSIRSVDMSHYILIPGYDWQGAWSWDKESDCLKDMKDPGNHLIFAAHQYFDRDYSGSKYDSSSCSDIQRGVTLSKPFVDWLQKNNFDGMFTEYGVPQDTCWLGMLDTFLQSLQKNPHILGGIYWAAGPAWGNYNLSVEPENGQDKPQMKILEKYPSE